MNKSKSKILFISHDATRTGAPIVLKYHLEALKNLGLNFDVLLKNGGAMEKEFEDIANTYKIPQIGIFEKIIKKISKSDTDFFINKIIDNQYKLIVGNTVVTGGLLTFFKKKGANNITVCYVHELEIAIEHAFGRDNFRRVIPYIDYFIACSQTVKNNLINNYNIPEDKINLHYEHIPMVGAYSVKDTVIKLKPGMKICGSGTLDWRKGIDVFIQTAYNFNKEHPEGEFHFYWIGGQKNSLDYARVIYDIEKYAIGDRITIIENCPNPLDYIGQCDVFMLTSREDPFPLVCLEAASLGLPIICFDKAGGMVEFINDSNGWVVDYLDTGKLVLLLGQLLTDNLIIEKKGSKAAADSKKYDIITGAKKLKGYIDKLLINVQ